LLAACVAVRVCSSVCAYSLIFIRRIMIYHLAVYAFVCPPPIVARQWVVVSYYYVILLLFACVVVCTPCYFFFNAIRVISNEIRRIVPPIISRVNCLIYILIS
jgi:sensor histidine kinase YesM